MKVTLQSEYVGGSPKEDGNYLVIDVLTNEEFVSKVFTQSETRQVLSGRDCQIHPLNEFDTPSIRWVLIHPLPTATLDKLVKELTL